jgi:Domain of Unknown Function (DUF1080)
MKRIVAAILFAGAALAEQPGPPNTLTAEEAKQGFKLLWDGKTMDGWEAYDARTGKWKIENGVLTAEPRAGWFGTKADYANFSLKIDVRTTAENINSGIHLRRGRVAGDSHTLGYEMQIRNPNPKDAPYDGKPDNHNGYYTGSFSGHLKSKNEPKVEMGKWHTFEITAQGDHFIVVVDGKKVLDDRHGEFKNGAIGLQYTGQPVEFRNIKIKTL